MDDADLGPAVSAAVSAGFACAGQWCTSTSRVFAQKGIHGVFLSRLAERCEAMRIGDPLDAATDMGPVAGPEQYRRVRDVIDQASADGARLVTGGACTRELGARGYFVRPTVFVDVTPAMGIFSREIFGSVLAIASFADIEEALDLASNSP
jgi:betaine-aldehyde dehydrogenase